MRLQHLILATGIASGINHQKGDDDSGAIDPDVVDHGVAEGELMMPCLRGGVTGAVAKLHHHLNRQSQRRLTGTLRSGRAPTNHSRCHGHLNREHRMAAVMAHAFAHRCFIISGIGRSSPQISSAASGAFHRHDGATAPEK